MHEIIIYALNDVPKEYYSHHGVIYLYILDALIKKSIENETGVYYSEEELRLLAKDFENEMLKAEDVEKVLSELIKQPRGIFRTQNRIGEDSEGTPLYPNDIVIDDAGDERKIEFGKYTEQFGFGYIQGYYIPDYCIKKQNKDNNDTE